MQITIHTEKTTTKLICVMLHHCNHTKNKVDCSKLPEIKNQTSCFAIESQQLPDFVQYQQLICRLLQFQILSNVSSCFVGCFISTVAATHQSTSNRQQKNELFSHQSHNATVGRRHGLVYCVALYTRSPCVLLSTCHLSGAHTGMLHLTMFPTEE